MIKDVRTILNAAARATGLGVSTILGSSRKRSCCATRAAVVYLARTRTGVSYPELGRILRRHHTSVLNAHQVFSLRLDARDARACDLLRRIEREIEHGGRTSGAARNNSSQY